MTRLGSMVAASMTLVLSALPALAQQSDGAGNAPPGYYYRHMWGWGGGWHTGMFFAPLLWLLILAAVVMLCMRMFGWRRHGDYHRRPGGALDILEERFARGEIDKAEFEEKRKTLGR